MTFDSQGRLITLCSTLTRVVAYIVDPDTLEVLDKKIVGDRRPRLTDFSGGGYFILDNQDRIVFPARGGTLRILSTVDGLRDVDNIDVHDAGTRRTGHLRDARLGRALLVRGVAGHRRRDPRWSRRGPESRRRDIENSFAVARDAVYVVSGAALYRLEAQDGGPPRIVWRTEYDRGTMRKPGQTSRASGPPRPSSDSGWRHRQRRTADERPGRRHRDRWVTCRQPVFGDGASATDNALIAINNHLVVENNYGYRPAVTSTTAGRSTTPGMAAVSVDPVTGACALAWENDQVYVPSVVSKGTGIGGLIITYTKPPNPIGADAWYFTAVDVRTGEVVWTPGGCGNVVQQPLRRGVSGPGRRLLRRDDQRDRGAEERRAVRGSMGKVLRRLGLGLLAIIVVLGLVAASPPGRGFIGEKLALRDGAQAYLIGYPLVTMQATRQALVQPPAQMNAFIHARYLPDARNAVNVISEPRHGLLDSMAGPARRAGDHRAAGHGRPVLAHAGPRCLDERGGRPWDPNTG